MAIELEDLGNGVWSAPGARIIDRTGRRMLPIGHDGFVPVAESFAFVDKTMLIADVLDSRAGISVICRPDSFGKTLNMTMMRAFFEIPPDGQSRAPLFEGTEVWEAAGGRYREHQGTYPVIHLSMCTAKNDTWEASYASIRSLVTAEYQRHAYLERSDALLEDQRNFVRRVMSGAATEADYAGSLIELCRMLWLHHGRRVVLLIDEYDAPVMAGYSAPGGGYYREVVSFLKGWLTGALKDGGEALAFACLTGVQRVTKESVFSDLNNIVVSTALDTRFDERFGFTDAEVEALAAYTGHPGCMEEAREWYDGYRFGDVDVYNPWSVLNYFAQGCSPDVYWGSTSSSAVLGDLLRNSDASTLGDVYALLEPGGVVWRPLDLGVVFPEDGATGEIIWSMLYLAGYLTTDQTALPGDTLTPRPLRIPNHEIELLYRTEIVQRFASVAGGRGRLMSLHRALVTGDENVVASALGGIERDSASYLDLVSEGACHMLVLGLLFGMGGYADPVSNREAGYGRLDIRVEPVPVPAGHYAVARRRPLLTIELKFARDADELDSLASAALLQISGRGYDAGPLPQGAFGRMRWGIAFGSRRVAVASEFVE